MPRELFVPSKDVLAAYDSNEPLELAMMLQTLALAPADRVLEIGTGSGYSAAVISQLVSHVYTVEHNPSAAFNAADRLTTLGFDGIDVSCGDGVHGWRDFAPYDAIIVNVRGLPITEELLAQLAVGGRLVHVDDVHAWPATCSLRSA